MKWFKHYENANTNRFIQALLKEKNGLELYAMWFLLLEFLCGEFKEDDKLFHASFEQLKRAMRVSHDKKLAKIMEIFREFSANFDENLLEISEISGKFYEIKTPIILELMGKDFKKARHRGATAAAKKKEERRKKKKKNIYSTSDACASDYDFEEIYRCYPRKIGKIRGIKRLQSAIKTQDQYDSLRNAVNNYAEHVADKPKEYIKHFSSFVSEWQDWIEVDASEKHTPFDWSRYE